MDITVKLGLIKLLQKRFDICEEAYVSPTPPFLLATLGFNITYRSKSDLDIKCPVQVGEYDVSQTVALPKEIPPGTIHHSIHPAASKPCWLYSQVYCGDPGLHS